MNGKSGNVGKLLNLRAFSHCHRNCYLCRDAVSFSSAAPSRVLTGLRTGLNTRATAPGSPESVLRHGEYSRDVHIFYLQINQALSFSAE